MMNKNFALIGILMLCACSQDPYHLKISNNMADAHGQSIYFRSNMRSAYAGQIRRVLSNKFAESGIKTSTTPEGADYVAIFDIETFYKQSGDHKNTSYANTANDTVLFTTEEDGVSLGYSGNANMAIDHDKTCFTLNIGRRDTSVVSYTSNFCAADIFETEEILPMVLDIYGKYANYQSADVGVQCITLASGDISCDAIHDRQQAFINSLWLEHDIVDD